MYGKTFVGVERYDDDGDVFVRDDIDVAILWDGEAFVSSDDDDDDTDVPRDGDGDGICAKFFSNERRLPRVFLRVLYIGMFEPSLPVRKRFSR